MAIERILIGDRIAVGTVARGRLAGEDFMETPVMLSKTVWAGIACLGTMLLFTAGCSSTYSFKVDAISNPESEGHESFKIVSSDPNLRVGDLEFKELSDYVKTALSGKGLYEAPDAASADMVIDLSYGMGEPMVDFKSHTAPVIAKIPGTYRRVAVPVKTTSGGTVMMSRQVYVPGRREIIDMEERMVPVTTYEKFLRLTARDSEEEDASEGSVQVWSIYVKNKDESDDLRKYLPLMAAAAIPYVGENTDSHQEIRMKGSDSDVSFVKAGM